MRRFSLQLNTEKNGLVYAGAVGANDYSSCCIAVSFLKNDEILDLSTFSDIALNFNTGSGTKGTFRLMHECMSVQDNMLLFNVPGNLFRETGTITMQIQLFKNGSRLTVLNRFMLEVKSVLEGNSSTIEEEIKPIADEIFIKLNKKLDKEEGGIVEGNVNFTGGLQISGEPIEILTQVELEQLLN